MKTVILFLAMLAIFSIGCSTPTSKNNNTAGCRSMSSLDDETYKSTNGLLEFIDITYKVKDGENYKTRKVVKIEVISKQRNDGAFIERWIVCHDDERLVSYLVSKMPDQNGHLKMDVTKERMTRIEAKGEKLQ